MLFPHNVGVFNDLEQTLENNNCCCVVMGTGVGKTYVTSEYLDKHNLKALIVAPRNSICDSWQKHRSDVDTITYQKLANIYKDIDFSNYDVVVCDEVHHIGAPTWGKPIKHLIDNNIIKVIGLTESSIRYTDGGKDVAEDFFNGNVAYGETVSSAIEKKILNPVTYVGAMFNSDGLKHTLRGKIQSRLYAKLNLALNKTPTVAEILKKHMPKGKRKGIIFASTIEDIKSAMEFVKSVYPKVEIRFVHSKQSQSYNEETFEWFKNTNEGYICSVDMISEGVHIKGVNTLIMLRRTESVNLFNQQLGRCLDASSKEPAILFDLVNNKYSIRIINDKLKIRTNSIFGSGKLNVVPSKQLIVNDYTKDIVDVLQEIKISLEGRWTEEEDNLLREFYKEHPDGRGLKKFAQENLKNRTSKAIYSRASDLGLNSVELQPSFSESEIEIIKKYYPNEGTKCYARLNGRSRQSIANIAFKLGIKFDMDSWSEEDLKIIKKYYPSEGKNITKRLPHKSLRAIKHQAQKLNICSFAFSTPWSKEEDKIIKDNYNQLGSVGLVKLLPNRTKVSIVTRIKRLGLKRTKQKIRCVETGQIFNPVSKEISKALNISSSHLMGNVSKSCKDINKTAYGYHWEYVEEEN